MEMTQREINGLILLTADNLNFPGLRHAFSTRPGGVSEGHLASLNLRGATPSGDDPARVITNYRRFCAAVGLEAERVVLSKQVHEDTVRLVTDSDAGKGLWRERDYTADALITNVPNLPLFVFSADCGIILLYDPINRAVGAIHAGWRGCAAGIVEKTVAAMGNAYGTDPRKLLAAIGPCIGPCCFETDGDVPEAMRAALGPQAERYLQWQAPKWHVDLAGLNRQWLLRAGVSAEHISVSGLCTGCRPDFFWSHRKMGNARGAQVAAIALEAL